MSAARRRLAAAGVVVAGALAAVGVTLWRCVPEDRYPSERRRWPA